MKAITIYIPDVIAETENEVNIILKDIQGECKAEYIDGAFRSFFECFAEDKDDQDGLQSVYTIFNPEGTQMIKKISFQTIKAGEKSTVIELPADSEIELKFSADIYVTKTELVTYEDGSKEYKIYFSEPLKEDVTVMLIKK